MSIKIERIASMMEKEISMILQREARDEILKEVVISCVEVTNDLSFAKVYFTCYNKNQKSEILKALENAKGFIRTELASRIDVRHVPELRFIFDESIEYGIKIEKKIKELNEQNKNN